MDKINTFMSHGFSATAEFSVKLQINWTNKFYLQHITVHLQPAIASLEFLNTVST